MVSYLKPFLYRRGQGVINPKIKLLLTLFSSFFRIGIFTWGGGYAMVPLIQQVLVDKKKLMSDEDFINTLSVAQSLPGAIAINTAGLVGIRIAGIQGLLMAVLGSVLPSFIIIIFAVTVLRHYGDLIFVQHFFRGAIPAIVALIASGILSIAKRALTNNYDLIISGVFLGLILIFGFHPFWIILLGVLTGLVKRS